MNDSQKTLLGALTVFGVFALAVIGLVLSLQPQASPRDDGPLVVSDLDLTADFAKNPDAAERRVHAQELADVMELVIEGVDDDGRDEPENRLFKSGATVDQNIVAVRTFYMKRWSFAEQYPTLGKSIGTYLKQRLGKDLSDTLTDDRRAEWIQALKEVRASALEI